MTWLSGTGRLARRHFLFLLAALLCAGHTHASGIVISPTLVELSPGEHSRVVTLQNNASQTRHYQVQLFAWHQQDGENRYAQQDTLLVTPPISQVAAGSRQLIRIVRQNRDVPEQEQSYRLIISELPDDPDTGTPMSVDMLLRLSVPVFTAGTRAGRPALTAQLATHEGQAVLTLHNHGGRHARLTQGEWLLTDTPGRAPWQPGLAGYVLPGQAMSWPVDSALDTGQLAGVEVRVNGETQQLRWEAAR